MVRKVALLAVSDFYFTIRLIRFQGKITAEVYLTFISFSLQIFTVFLAIFNPYFSSSSVVSQVCVLSVGHNFSVLVCKTFHSRPQTT